MAINISFLLASKIHDHYKKLCKAESAYEKNPSLSNKKNLEKLQEGYQEFKPKYRNHIEKYGLSDF